MMQLHYLHPGNVGELREHAHVRSATLGFSLFGASVGTAIGGLSMIVPIVPVLAIGGGAFGLAGRMAAMKFSRESEEDLSRLLAGGGMLLMVNTQQETETQRAIDVLDGINTRDLHVSA